MTLSVKEMFTKILPTLHTIISATKWLHTDGVNLTVQIEATSFNNPEGTGVWYMSGASNASPTNGNVYGMLFQIRSPYSMHPTWRDAVYTQLFINYTGKVYVRVLNNAAWTSWVTVA